MKILIVEDDMQVGRLLQRILDEDGYAVDLVHTGEEARTLAFVHEYDGIVLDLELPDHHGFTILQELRRQGRTTPILILTGLAEEAVVVRGLNAGADDFVRKPVSSAEFRARVGALVRRGGGAGRTEVLEFADVTLNRLTHQARCATRPLDLTPKEFALLEHFLQRPGEIVHRTDLLEKLWDQNFDPASNVVDVHLARLRAKLRDAETRIGLRTVRGVGIQLVDRGAGGV